MNTRTIILFQNRTLVTFSKVFNSFCGNHYWVFSVHLMPDSSPFYRSFQAESGRSTLQKVDGRKIERSLSVEVVLDRPLSPRSLLVNVYYKVASKWSNYFSFLKWAILGPLSSRDLSLPQSWTVILTTILYWMFISRLLYEEFRPWIL